MNISRRLSVAVVGLLLTTSFAVSSSTVAGAQELRELLLERMEAQQQMNPNAPVLPAELMAAQASAAQNTAPLQGFASRAAMPQAAQPAQKASTQYNIVHNNSTTSGAPAGLAAMAAAALGAAVGDSCAVPYAVPVPYGAYGAYDRYGAAAAHYGAYRGEEYAHAGEVAGASAAHYGAVQGEESAARGAAVGESAAHYGATEGAEAAARGDAFGHAEAAGGFDHGFAGRGFGGFGGRFGGRR